MAGVSDQRCRKSADQQQVILGLPGLVCIELHLDVVRPVQQRLEGNREKQGARHYAHCLFRHEHTRID